ncbi:MAG: glycosyltransferase family 9 protein [Armatimonadota bacterium]|nr:glycosyltransferase family 9 protein [Armatimonadota bacterium]
MRSILLLNLNHIGDVLFTTPAISALRERHPSARIVCVAHAGVADALKENPDIDEIILRHNRSLLENARIGLGLRSWKFDISYCFTFSSYKLAAIGVLAGAKERVGFSYRQLKPFLTVSVPNDNSKHQAESYLDLVRATGPVDSTYPMRMCVSEKDQQVADKFLAGAGYNGSGPLVGINPGGTVRINQWFPDRFAALADRLQKDGATVVIFGGKSETYLAEVITKSMKTKPIIAAGKTTIWQLAGLISRCGVMITGDTGPMHMAVSLDVPTVAIFGPANPSRTGPYTDNCVVLWQKLPCSPCRRKPTCSFRECIDATSVDMVYDATRQLLSNPTAASGSANTEQSAIS